MKTQPNRPATLAHDRAPACLSAIATVLLALAALTMVALAAAGCSGPPSTPVASRPITPTRPLQPTTPPMTPNIAETNAITLTWWTPEFLSPEAPGDTGKVLTDQLTEFEEAQGGKVRVEAVRKARYGKGGLLDALRTAQPIAANTLPDIVALDAVEVEKAVEAGLLQPLDTLLDTKVIESLYPFASEAGLFSERLYAVQYLADIDHAAYLPSQITEPPSRWEELLVRRTSYLFPLAAPQPVSQGSSARPAEGLSTAVLSQYLSAGATLDPDRRLVLEPQPLLRLLTFYADASQEAVLPPAAQELSDGEAVWGVFSQGQAPLAYVSARRFLAGGDVQRGYAAAPGQTESALSLAGGWTLAIVTPDPERQQAAAELIAWLLEPENAGGWARSANWLPTSSNALRVLGSGPYWDFLDAQLAQARSLPAGADYAATARRMQAAIQTVVQGQSDAASATEAAINGQQ